MNIYIYCADLYCEACGRDIRRRLRNSGLDPNECAGPFPDGGGESDCPQHCGSGAHCLTMPFCFLENPLTADGYNYVRENQRAEWREFYLEANCF